MDIEFYNNSVKAYSDGLYRFALKNCGNTEEAKDIVQQCYEVLWKEIDNVSFEKAKSFLFTIAYRRSMDWHRQHAKLQYTETFSEMQRGSTIIQIDAKNLVHKALETLDSISKNLVILKDIEGYNYDEMVQITSLSLSQVKVYLHRARKKMKDFIIANQ